MPIGFDFGFTNSGRKSSTERLYAINDAGEQEPVYDQNGEPIYTKRES